jgi:uncharacterized membrane protein
MPDRRRDTKARHGATAGGVLCAVAIAFGASPAAAQEPGDARPRARCYGVAPAGENQGIDDREAPGSSTRDYQGNAWVLVPQGECTGIVLPPQADGTPRRGAIEPLARDRG